MKPFDELQKLTEGEGGNGNETELRDEECLLYEYCVKKNIISVRTSLIHRR